MSRLWNQMMGFVSEWADCETKWWGFYGQKSGSSCCNSANTDLSFLFFSFWINKLLLCYFMKSLGALDLYYVWNIWSTKKFELQVWGFESPLLGGQVECGLSWVSFTGLYRWWAKVNSRMEEKIGEASFSQLFDQRWWPSFNAEYKALIIICGLGSQRFWNTTNLGKWLAPIS